MTATDNPAEAMAATPTAPATATVASAPGTPPILYHVPPSFYSQVARLVLVEKQVAFELRAVVPGPPSFSTYAPWYMRLNPMGTVPTLIVDGEALDDSRVILEEVERRFDGPALRPARSPEGPPEGPPERAGNKGADTTAEVDRWVDEAYQISERVLAYGSGRMRSVGRRVNDGRRRALLDWRERTPDMRPIYDAKLADLDRFMADAADDDAVSAQLSALRDRLDALDAALEARRFVAGDAYSLADVVWTVTVARKIMMGEDPFPNRPHLRAWFDRMRARPSFDRADVWTRFKPHKMLPIALREFRRPLALGALLLAAALAAAHTLA